MLACNLSLCYIYLPVPLSLCQQLVSAVSPAPTWLARLTPALLQLPVLLVVAVSAPRSDTWTYHCNVCVCVCLEECDVRVGRTLVSHPWNTNLFKCVCVCVCVCVVKAS